MPKILGKRKLKTLTFDYAEQMRTIWLDKIRGKLVSEVYE